MESQANPAPSQDVRSGLARWVGPLRGLAAGGVDLASPLARARLARFGVWAMLMVLVLSAVAALFTAARAVRLAARAGEQNPAGAALGPAGWAQSYVTAYVSAGAGKEQRLKPFLADPPEMEARPDVLRATRTAVVEVRQVGSGYWSITVSADLVAVGHGGHLVGVPARYYRVALTATSHGFAAVSLPAQVGAPERAPAPPLAYGGTSLSGESPAFNVVARFLDAYLAGRGELARYETPQAGVKPILPAPFRRTTLTKVIAKVDPASARGEVAVLADVRAVDAGGRIQQLTYALRLAVRAGAWMVTAMDAAPLLVQERSTQ